MQEIHYFINKHPLLILVWIILFILAIITTFKSFFINKKIKILNRHDAIFLINKKNAIVVDVRSRDDYFRGHIPGAVNVSKEDITKAKLNILEKHKLKPIIVVCTTGQNLINLALQLNNIGFTQVFILKNGIDGWNNENLPLVRSN